MDYMELVRKNSYLGMQICFEDKYITVDIIHYIKKMLKKVEHLKESGVPANKFFCVVT